MREVRGQSHGNPGEPAPRDNNGTTKSRVGCGAPQHRLCGVCTTLDKTRSKTDGSGQYSIGEEAKRVVREGHTKCYTYDSNYYTAEE